MARQGTLTKIVLPMGQSTARYAPATVARRILNMEVGEEGVLRSIAYPVYYEPRHLDEWAGVPTQLGQVHGVHHALLMGGTREVLLINANGTLYHHEMGFSGWRALATGLRNSDGADMPVQFCTVGDKIVYCDGESEPLIIDGMLRVVPLGFSQQPSAPTIMGPQSPDASGRANFLSGSYGYAFHGGLGTPGDVLSGVKSGILRSSYTFYIMLEDIHGNLSAPSPASINVEFGPLQASPGNRKAGNAAYDGSSYFNIAAGVEVEDLTRGVSLRLSGRVPDHTKYVRVYQTEDQNNRGNTPRLIHRLAAGRGVIHTGKSTGSMGAAMPRTIPVPTFSVIATFQGCLVGADGARVHKSEPGYPGTFLETSFVGADDNAATVTAIAAFQGRLYAFTASAVVDITDFANPVTLSRSVGCSGPSAIALHPALGLCFLHTTGVYSLSKGGLQSLTEGNERDFRYRWNTSRFVISSMWYSPDHGDLRVSLASLDSSKAEHIMCYRPKYGWREYYLGMYITAVAVTSPPHQLQLVAGRAYTLSLGTEQVPYDNHDVFVLDKAVGYQPTGSVRQHVIETLPMYFSPQGEKRATVLSILFGFYESSSGTANVTFRRDQEEAGTTYPVTLLDVGGAEAYAANASIERYATYDGILWATTSIAPVKRLFWRRLDLGASGVECSSFELKISSSSKMEIAALVVSHTESSETMGSHPAFDAS